jgi:hypothetical protein
VIYHATLGYPAANESIPIASAFSLKKTRQLVGAQIRVQRIGLDGRARQNIDKLLTDAGWTVQNKREDILSAARGVAVCEFPMKSGHGEANYLLFPDGSPSFKGVRCY